MLSVVLCGVSFRVICACVCCDCVLYGYTCVRVLVCDVSCVVVWCVCVVCLLVSLGCLSVFVSVV